RAYLPDGTLDPAFGASGVAQLESDSRVVLSMEVATDGKLLVALAGSPARLLRLNPDGSPDSSFGVEGKLDVDFGNSSDVVSDLALDAAGRILVAGGRSGVAPPE